MNTAHQSSDEASQQPSQQQKDPVVNVEKKKKSLNLSQYLTPKHTRSSARTKAKTKTPDTGTGAECKPDKISIAFDTFSTH